MQTRYLLASGAVNVGNYSLLLTTLRRKNLEVSTLADVSYAPLLTLSCYDTYASAIQLLPQIRPAATAAKMSRNFI